jgi:membrane protease YdiL (CAAX protease family)
MNDPYRNELDPWDDRGRQNPRHDAQRGDFESQEQPASSKDTSSREFVECWRCGKMGFKDLERCIYCRAPLKRDRPGRRSQKKVYFGGESAVLMKVAWFFILFLVVSIVYGFVQHFGLNPQVVFNRDFIVRMLVQVSVVETIDVLLVLAALLSVGRLKPVPTPPLTVRAATWATAAPLLLLLLGANVLYHKLIVDFLKLPVVEPDFVAHKDLLIWVIATVCIQPAIIEELFFRYLALGALRQVTGTHAAVLISAVMFGMAHIFAPLSIPMLIFIGLALGYVRVASGSIVLPMLMHFAHNLAVLFMK